MIRNLTRIAFAILIGFVASVLLARISPSLTLLFNVLSLVAIYFALDKGEIYGASVGMACGFVQDAFSSGIFGAAGLAKTIMGFSAGYVSRKIDVQPVIRRFVFLFFLLSLELVLWAFLYSFVFSDRIDTGKGLIAFQPLATSLLGSISFSMISKLENR